MRTTSPFTLWVDRVDTVRLQLLEQGAPMVWVESDHAREWVETGLKFGYDVAKMGRIWRNEPEPKA